MSQAAVVFDQGWKGFRRGEHHTILRDLIPSLMKRVMRRRSADETVDEQKFWAVRDVSFELQRGEAFGIMGPNGAGKSTTLKLLTKILKPTRGRCEVRGRVGALIEVAAGFHPDLTGRENVFLQGAIMGMKRSEISRKFDEIVEFAGVREFVDTPVKRYSSGMNARLGFSIAAHLDPDVLLIDEVLSVGDMAFQQRCVKRMAEFKRQGVTIVFVSHNLQAIADLCERALYLHGNVRSLGSTAKVIETYMDAVSRDGPAFAGTEVTVTKAELLNDQERQVKVATPGDALVLRVTFHVVEELEDIEFGFLLCRSTDGLMVYSESLASHALGLVGLSAGESVTIDFAFRANLLRGQYHVGCHMKHPVTDRFLCYVCPAAFFTVDESQSYSGIAHVDLGTAIYRRGGDGAGDPRVRLDPDGVLERPVARAK
jgi:lipopolysaccharide transport system ATP-binding protein